jgi:hypothetical protein
MGFSTFHRHLFFKHQSLSVTAMDIALESFPSTPWVFLFRSPIEVMVSHLDRDSPGGGSRAPCLRSQKNPSLRKEVVTYLVSGERTAENDEWCAAHLQMLCSYALKALSQFGNNNNGNRRGIPIDYSSLPGSLQSLIFPLFQYNPTSNVLTKISEESSSYSKQRKPGMFGFNVAKVSKMGIFKGDSHEKASKATASMKRHVQGILMKSFTLLAELAEQSAKTLLSPEDYNKLPEHATLPGVDWLSISALKLEASSTTTLSFLKGVMSRLHSSVIPALPPKNPFGNTHSSKTYETPDCPALPPPGYPKRYNVTRLLNNWNTDNTDIPSIHYDSLCHFDYSNPEQLKQAYAYRDAEVPFVVYNVPEVDAVVKKWSNLDYLQQRLGMYSSVTYYTMSVSLSNVLKLTTLTKLN